MSEKAKNKIPNPFNPIISVNFDFWTKNIFTADNFTNYSSKTV